MAVSRLDHLAKKQLRYHLSGTSIGRRRSRRSWHVRSQDTASACRSSTRSRWLAASFRSTAIWGSNKRPTVLATYCLTSSLQSVCRRLRALAEHSPSKPPCCGRQCDCCDGQGGLKRRAPISRPQQCHRAGAYGDAASHDTLHSCHAVDWGTPPHQDTYGCRECMARVAPEIWETPRHIHSGRTKSEAGRRSNGPAASHSHTRPATRVAGAHHREYLLEASQPSR
jgi:hypothetical protein